MHTFDDIANAETVTYDRPEAEQSEGWVATVADTHSAEGTMNIDAERKVRSAGEVAARCSHVPDDYPKNKSPDGN